MYTEKDLQKKIAELEKEVNNLANWLRNDENIENTDNLLFYMLLAINSLQHAQMLSVLSLNKYLEQNPDAAKY